MSGMPKVALLVGTARGDGREVLDGTLRCARLHQLRAFCATLSDFARSLPQTEERNGTKILARAATPQVTRVILATGLPLLAPELPEGQLAPGGPWARMNQSASDSEGAARLSLARLARACVFGNPGTWRLSSADIRG
jgi:hypothetical protein